MTEGTDNHLVLVDLTDDDVTGKAAEQALDSASITVNKNTVPNEKRSPFVTSGIRIGTPALTTRGMKEPEMKTIATWIRSIVKDVDNKSLQEKIKSEVKELCLSFPIYKKET